MYKNILVITDNIFIAKSFKKIVDELKLSINKIDFTTSPFSPAESFKDVTTLNAINLKDELSVKWIIENYDLVFSIHSKQIFPSALVKNVKCINVHPGYNPINRGWYPQVFAIINDFEIGATIHEIDEELDHGPIIDRELIEKHAWDTSFTLYNRVVEKELELLTKNLPNIISGNYVTISPEAEGQLFLKKDFNALLKLNLEELQTTKGFIDKLRALSHGEYANAYFIDEKSGNKIFVKLTLTPEVQA